MHGTDGNCIQLLRKLKSGMIILKRILKKEDMRVWTIFIWLRTGISEQDVNTVTNI
jgi:hypothetical protein